MPERIPGRRYIHQALVLKRNKHINSLHGVYDWALFPLSDTLPTKYDELQSLKKPEVVETAKNHDTKQEENVTRTYYNKLGGNMTVFIIVLMCLVTVILSSGVSDRRHEKNEASFDDTERLMLQGNKLRKKETDASFEAEIMNSFTEMEQAAQADVVLPLMYKNFAEMAALNRGQMKGLPFLFHIPNSGANAVETILSQCVGLTQASKAGAVNNIANESSLRVFHYSNSLFYNVDLSTYKGIIRARKFKLTSYKDLDVVSSNLLPPATTLFTPARKAKMFAVFRHPIKRAESIFYDSHLENITLDEWTRHIYKEDNWLVRNIAGVSKKQEVSERHLKKAKEVLRKYCLVGLFENFRDSMINFEMSFGWDLKTPEQQLCQEKVLKRADNYYDDTSRIREGNEAWKILYARNRWDIELYDWVRTKLYPNQSSKVVAEYHELHERAM